MSSDFGHHFSDRNVPFGIASSATHTSPQAVTRLGNTVLFLSDLANSGLFNHVEGLAGTFFQQSTLNDFAALSHTVHKAVRSTVQNTFKQFGLDGFPYVSKEDVMDITMHLPVEVKDFSGTTKCLRATSYAIADTLRFFLLLVPCAKCRKDYH